MRHEIPRPLELAEIEGVSFGNNGWGLFGFYAVLAASTFLGLTLSFVGVNPIKALFWSAILNGIVAVPVMALMMMATSEKVMGRFVLSPLLTAMGWFATAVMLAAATGFFLTWSD